MTSIRLRFVVAAVLCATPIVLWTAIEGSTVTAGTDCTDRAIDNDREYPGDNDVWCTPSPATSPTPATIPTPTTGPTPVPAPLPSPTATPSTNPIPPPTPQPPAGGGVAGGPCPAPGTFPTGFFAPSFVGPITRTFTSQYITDFGAYVETCYPVGSSAPSSGVPGGAQARLPMAVGSLDDATLTYQVRFPVGTQWVKGGKLPGLCGGLCWTGSNNGPGGWAARLMWRAGGAGEVLLSDATTTGYGTDLGRGTTFFFSADGQWHTIVEHVHLNTPGQPDGYIDLTYDGTKYTFGGITFRAAGDAGVHVDSLMFCTFYGGHDSTWAPTATQRFDFSGFSVS